MRKSITAFVFGLIGGLFCTMWGFIFGIAGEWGLSACKVAEADPAKEITIFTILGWLAFFGGIASIVGASQCFKNARRGAIILTSATIPCAALQIYIFSQIVSAAEGSWVFSSMILFLLPAIFLIVADICAFLAKDVPDLVYPQYGTSPQHQAAPVQKSNSSTLEEELTKLKTMFDKKLLTEEEYNQARQKAINQYTK